VRPKRAILAAPRRRFETFAAYGWDDKYEKGYVVALRAQPGFGNSQGTIYWVNFFEYLKQQLGPGMPEQIVCDADPNIRSAIDLVWPPSGPAPIVFTCHYHLTERLLVILRQADLHGSDPLYVAAEAALNWRASGTTS
jgi:hypothetical protein